MVVLEEYNKVQLSIIDMDALCRWEYIRRLSYGRKVTRARWERIIPVGTTFHHASTSFYHYSVCIDNVI